MTTTSTRSCLLAVFAHPDDELFIAPILSRYAREGVDCHVAIATDGRFGITQHMNNLAGDELAALRNQEMQQSTQQLAINKPTMLGLEDGFSHKTPVLKDALAHIKLLFNKIHKLILELKPTALITFGPDGIYGHPDHTTVGNVVSMVYQHCQLDFPCQLYYPGLNTDVLAATLPDDFNIVDRGTFPVDKMYLPIKISFSEADRLAAHRSLSCHQSQFTPEQIAKMVKRFYSDGHIYFRPWNGECDNKRSFF